LSINYGIFKKEWILNGETVYKDMDFASAINLCELVDISIDDAILDVKDLFITLKYCYSGYEYFKQFVNFNDLLDSIINELKQLDINLINTNQLGSIITKHLKKYLNDGHFNFITKDQNFSMHKPYYAYVTSIIVEECDGDYKVIKGNKKLPLGTIISKNLLEDKLLPTLTILSNKLCYLIGVYSNIIIENITIGNIKLNTHILNADRYERNSPDYIYKFNEHKTYNLLQSKKYTIYENKEEFLKKFYEFGLKSKKKNVVIFDIAGNRGGWSAFPDEFIKGLNDYSNWKKDIAIIRNDIFGNGKNKKIYEILYGKDYDTSKCSFDGMLYVVINKKTASSGEAAISYARSCRNVIFVGSASAGVGLFGDIKSYLLTRSKIYISMPYKVYFEGQEEGKGFLPNYWIDSKNPTKYLEKWLKHNNKI